MSLPPEKELIQRIQEIVGLPSNRVLLGIGDDAAVLKASSQNLVVTVDSLVEGSHFDLKYWSYKEIGYKALAVNLSDLAAMGANPKAALISLGVPDKVSLDSFLDIYKGMKPLLQEFKVDLIGGNLSKSAVLFLDIQLMGEVGEHFFTRDKAQPGDVLAITGPLGGAKAAFLWVQKFGKKSLEDFPKVADAFFKPVPRVHLSQALVKTKYVTSLMDISDGLSTDLNRLAEASGVSFKINAIPFFPELNEMANKLGEKPENLALHGGEDYELLMTLKPHTFEEAKKEVKLAGGDLFKIGEAVEGEGIFLSENGKTERLIPKGWDHFSNFVK